MDGWVQKSGGEYGDSGGAAVKKRGEYGDSGGAGVKKRQKMVIRAERVKQIQ